MTLTQNFLWLCIVVNYAISAHRLGMGRYPWWFGVLDVAYAGLVVWFFVEASRK